MYLQHGGETLEEVRTEGGFLQQPLGCQTRTLSFPSKKGQIEKKSDLLCLHGDIAPNVAGL